MRVKFWVGDWSKDGHNQADNFVVDVFKLGQFQEITKAELDKAFQDGCALMGLSEEHYSGIGFLFCSEYEDYKIPQEVVDGLKKVGLDPDKYFDTDYRDKNQRTGSYDTFHLLWLDIARVGSNYNLYYVECVGEETYHIGGYGLYN